MEYGNFEAGLIRKQNRYIQSLEEELAFYKEKDRMQTELIGNLNQMLDLFRDGLRREADAEKTAGEENADE